MNHLGTPDFMRAAFAQRQQAGGVIDLAVQQDDRTDGGVAGRTGRLQGRKGLELGADVRRRIAQDQSTPLSLMAMDDWVRALALSVPARRPAQLAQLQFHCGKPPPAAEPRIRMNMDSPKAKPGRSRG